jgi:hypothetical protein
MVLDSLPRRKLNFGITRRMLLPALPSILPEHQPRLSGQVLFDWSAQG